MVAPLVGGFFALQAVMKPASSAAAKCILVRTLITGLYPGARDCKMKISAGIHSGRGPTLRRMVPTGASLPHVRSMVSDTNRGQGEHAKRARLRIDPVQKPLGPVSLWRPCRL